MITLGTSSQRSPTYAALKTSIILFDIAPGTRTFTVPEGVSRIRAFVVGAGGSGNPATSSGYLYSPGGGGGYEEITLDVTPGQEFVYTVGNAVPYVEGQKLSGETTSFGGLISATGGQNAYTTTQATTQLGGIGMGGDVHAEGGEGKALAQFGGGAGSRFGKGTSSAGSKGGGFARVGDGWGIGLYDGGAPAIMLPGYFAPRMGAGGFPHLTGNGEYFVQLFPLVGGGGGSAPSIGSIGGVGAVGMEVLA